MWAISKLRIVWTNACAAYILEKGYPFPSQPLDAMSVSELEQRTCHAFYLSSRWLSGLSQPRRTLLIDATAAISASLVRFLPGRFGDWLVTVSKSIWHVLTIWDISSEPPRKACDWSPRGAIFSGMAVNADPASEATLALSVAQNQGSVAISGNLFLTIFSLLRFVLL